MPSQQVVSAPRRKQTNQRIVKPAGVNHRTLVGHARRARTRLKIIETAAQVFAVKGIEAVVIDDFIRAAGVARGTFYNHFRTIGELLDATVAWSSDDVIRSIEAEISAYDDPALRLATGCRLFLRLAERDRDWCAFVVQVPQLGVLTRRQMRMDLRNGLAAGVLQFDDVEAAYDLVSGAMRQVLRRIVTVRRRYDSNVIVSMVLRGLGVPRARVLQLLATPLPELRRRIKSEALFANAKNTRSE